MIRNCTISNEKMCNNFIEDIAWKIGRKMAKCDCVKLKDACKERKPSFQLTSGNVRSLFTETEFYGAHGYDFSVMFTNFDYCKEFVDMALCYLHEGDIEKFFLLVSHMSEYNYGNLNINSSIKEYAKKQIEKHLSCISLPLLDNYYVHVGFGEWNERDDLRTIEFLSTHKYRRFANKSLTNQEYISVTLSYWLHIFLTEEKPRSFMYEVFLKANKDEDPHVYLPNFKFEHVNTKKQAFKIQGNFSQKLGKRVLDILSCECIKYKDFEYVPRNVINILKSFQFHSHDRGFMYRICRFKTSEDTDEIPVVPLFLDIALCCLYEKDYEEFVNIAGQVGTELNLGMNLRKHIDIVSYKDVKKYLVNIQINNTHACKLYLKSGKKDNKIKRHDEYGMFEKYTDYERYGKPYSKRFLNISFDRFLSDLLVHPNPYPIWQKIWQRD